MKVVPEFALSFLEGLREDGKKDSTLTRYYRDLSFFFKWVKSYKNKKEITFEEWKSLDTDLYKHFYNECIEKYSNSTVKRIRTVVSSLQRFYELDIADFEGLADSIVARSLTSEDFVTEDEVQKLLETMRSRKDLTDNQLKGFPFLSNRNQAIVFLFYYYGLRMTEITRIDMEDLNFGQRELVVKDGDGSKRVLKLDHEHQQVILKYCKEDIPKSVRPYEHSKHPLFVAFDFERETFRWNYEANTPKRLGVKAIQKMIKQEVKRAGLRNGISGQSMRNSCILRKINEGKATEQLQLYFGLKNPLSLWRYEKYNDSKKA